MANETKTLERSEAVAQAIAILAAVKGIPGTHWALGDDACDCTFQQVSEWSNPYIAQTLRVRWCCILEELFKMFPQHVTRIDAYYDHNRDKYVAEPREWDSCEMDMPVYLWFRQLAKKQGRTLEQIRQEYGDRKAERPKKVAARKKDTPTREEMQRARQSHLKRAGWIL